jgi:hypothetical protein
MENTSFKTKHVLGSPEKMEAWAEIKITPDTDPVKFEIDVDIAGRAMLARQNWELVEDPAIYRVAYRSMGKTKTTAPFTLKVASDKLRSMIIVASGSGKHKVAGYWIVERVTLGSIAERKPALVEAFGEETAKEIEADRAQGKPTPFADFAEHAVTCETCRASDHMTIACPENVHVESKRIG